MDFVRFLIHEFLYAWCLKSIIFAVPGFEILEYQLVSYPISSDVMIIKEKMFL